MKEQVRRAIDELCFHATEQFTPTFGIPSTLHFGDTPQEGVATTIARSDHVHGMPDAGSFVLDLETSTMFLSELLVQNTGTNTPLATDGAIVIGGRDDAGNTGAFGSLDYTTTTAATDTAGVWVRQNITGSTLQTDTNHVWKRTSTLEMRVRPVLNSTHLQDCRILIGGFRLNTNNNLDSVNTGSGTGVYFRADTNASGTGNYFAHATNAGADSSADTGVAPIVNGDSTVAFQTFRITWDGTSLLFFIDGTSVATITTNIPSDSNKLAGFGALLQNRTGVARTGVIDNILITGTRNYLG